MSDDTGLNPLLLLVLEHLSDSYETTAACNTAARGLHLASSVGGKGYSTAIWAKRRSLRLERYYKGLLSARSSHNLLALPAIPWTLLGAGPEVTYLTLHPQQLESITDALVQQHAAAVGRLKHLSVWSITPVVAEQLRGLGRLLQAATQLESLTVNVANRGELQQPWLILDPPSTSYSTMAVPHLPLRTWWTFGVPYDLLVHWLAQQPPGNPLTQLVTLKCGGYAPTLDISPLTAIAGLRKLSLDGYVAEECSSSLRSMTSVTKLVLGGWRNAEAAQAVAALTGLRGLAFSERIPEVPNSYSSLQQLTALRIRLAKGTDELPADLGDWLPRLEYLEVKEAEFTSVPASLSSLTALDLPRARGTSLTLPTTLTRLNKLLVARANFMSIEGLGSLPALQALDVSGSCALGSSLSVLAPLTGLRSLNLDCTAGLDPASFTVIGALQQLTALNLACTGAGRYITRDPSEVVEAQCRALASTPPLPALQQLDISGHGAASVAALAPWVARLNALTQLCMDGCGFHAEEQQLDFLPEQLRELDTSNSSRGFRREQLPTGLQRLTALEVLRMKNNTSLCQLPTWLSELRRLEVLNLRGTGELMLCGQHVLTQMPALRYCPVNSRHAYGRASHLHFGHSTR
jgi:Leucine-rich repeat (LRR) protein